MHAAAGGGLGVVAGLLPSDRHRISVAAHRRRRHLVGECRTQRRGARPQHHHQQKAGQQQAQQGGPDLASVPGRGHRRGCPGEGPDHRTVRATEPGTDGRALLHIADRTRRTGQGLGDPAFPCCRRRDLLGGRWCIVGADRVRRTLGFRRRGGRQELGSRVDETVRVRTCPVPRWGCSGLSALLCWSVTGRPVALAGDRVVAGREVPAPAAGQPSGLRGGRQPGTLGGVVPAAGGDEVGEGGRAAPHVRPPVVGVLGGAVQRRRPTQVSNSQRCPARVNPTRRSSGVNVRRGSVGPPAGRGRAAGAPARSVSGRATAAATIRGCDR